MDEGTREQLKAVWRQTRAPVIYRRGSPHDLMVKLPGGEDERGWLRQPGKHRPRWNRQYAAFEVPQAWHDPLIYRCADRFGEVYVIQPFNAFQKCALKCREAQGEECECQCGGEFHGSEHATSGWKDIGDTFSIRWEGRELACRHIRRRSSPPAA